MGTDKRGMYERYFNLTARPFAMNPDPAFLYPSSQHTAALTMLEYAMEAQAPFCLLTGEIGSGKTTLLRRFLRDLGANVTVGLISNTHAGFRSIQPWALSAFSIVPQDDSDIAHYEALTDFFVREYAKGRRTLLVLDEAHNLSAPILEELRLLSNINSEKDIALQVLLVGQPELRKKLEMPELEQFAQRVSVDFHLESLTLKDAHAYIQHRLTIAGGDPALFQQEAVAFVHARTRGVPRLMNQICDLALVYAYAEQQSWIDLRLVQHVLQDRKKRGAMPLFATRATAASGPVNSSVDAGVIAERS
jgi:general secretion pathway protein A